MNELWRYMNTPESPKPALTSVRLAIITGSARYEKELPRPGFWSQMRQPIWKLCTETLNQLESEQYILSKGFERV